MTAFIGLIGVFVGALLTLIVNLTIERTRRRTLAIAAGELIAADLDEAKTHIESAIEGNNWWADDLPSAAWKEHRDELVLEVGRDLYRALQNTFASTALWDRDRKKSIPFHSRSEELKQDRVTIQGVHAALTKYLEPRSARDKPHIGRWVATALVFLLLLSIGLVPRPDVNTRTVGTALEKQLGSRTFAECDQAGDDWACTVYHLSQPRGTCLATGMAMSGALPPGLVAMAAPKRTKSPCTQTRPPTKVDVVHDGDDLVETRHLTPSEIARGKFRETVKELKEPTRSWLHRIAAGLRRTW